MSRSSQRPNILFMIPHDLGTFLGCYGESAVSSTHLDRLAARGVRFSNCFTTSPECSPSRSSMMTGLHTHQNGMTGLSNFGWSLRVPHLAARLREAGYTTHQFGFQHETHDDVHTLGYEHVHPVPKNRASDVCEQVCSFLHSDDAAGQSPWFIYAGFFDVHRPWCASSQTRFDSASVRVPPWLPDTPTVRADLARFYQDIEDMDRAAGTVCDAIAASGLADNTLVIFATDHGAAFPAAKATLYDAGVHIPMIMHWPGHIEGGRTYDELVSSMDLTPTLLELAGADVPDGLAGRSMLPLLSGGEYRGHEYVAGELFYDVAYDPMHYVRTDRYKYIRSFAVTDEDAAGADTKTLSTFRAGRWVRVDDFDVLTGPTWQAMERQYAPDGAPRPPREELYDVQQDPHEQENLADDPAAADVLAQMRSLMQKMMSETNSPLLQGHLSPSDRQQEIFPNYTPDSQRYIEAVASRQKLMDT